jgi:hypothetical protein
MATPTADQMRTLTIADFMTEYVIKPSIFDNILRKRKSVADIEREVSKLKSVSRAGRAWIVDERCSGLSIGKHAGVYRFPKM